MDCPMMEMFKDCPMMEMFKDCPMMKMMPMMMMMGGKKMKKFMKMMMMMKMMKCMMGGKCNKPCKKPCDGPCKKPCEGPCKGPCEGPCKKPCEGPCKGPCEGPCEQQPICLNTFPCCQPFACYKQGEYTMGFGKMGVPTEVLTKLKEKSCPFFMNPKMKFVLVCMDDTHDMCNKTLLEIVEMQDNITIIRLWTDSKGEFHVCHYQKCHKECKDAPKEEKKQ